MSFIVKNHHREFLINVSIFYMVRQFKNFYRCKLCKDKLCNIDHVVEHFKCKHKPVDILTWMLRKNKTPKEPLMDWSK